MKLSETQASFKASEMKLSETQDSFKASEIKLSETQASFLKMIFNMIRNKMYKTNEYLAFTVNCINEYFNSTD